MNSQQLFQYVNLAVRSTGRSRQHYAANATERERHHGEMLEVLFGLESVKHLLAQGYPQPCVLCGLELNSPDDNEWHGLGNCADICTHCGGSGEEPKVKGDVASAS